MTRRIRKILTATAVGAFALGATLLAGNTASAQAYYGFSPNGCIYVTPAGAVHGHTGYGVHYTVSPSAC